MVFRTKRTGFNPLWGTDTDEEVVELAAGTGAGASDFVLTPDNCVGLIVSDNGAHNSGFFMSTLGNDDMDSGILLGKTTYAPFHIMVSPGIRIYFHNNHVSTALKVNVVRLYNKL
jgi:hypothetical protein